MPHSAASAHIEQVVGDGLIAAEDLRLRLLSGDVEAQQRRVTPGAGIEIIPLTPESFEVSDALSDDLGPFSRSFPLHGHNIFLRCADVYRLWPIGGDDWMPHSAASAHIEQVVGDGLLAAEDLRLRLLSGDVEAQDRRVTPGAGTEIIPLTPEDLKGRYVLSFSGIPRLLGQNIFLRRADVYRAWPMRLAEPASPQDEQRSKRLPTARPKGLGPRAWLVAREVDALIREGGKGSNWIDLNDLLQTIRERIGAKDKSVPSRRTLDTALAFLRERGLIDR
jgi:hypothetical protein